MASHEKRFSLKSLGLIFGMKYFHTYRSKDKSAFMGFSARISFCPDLKGNRLMHSGYLQPSK